MRFVTISLIGLSYMAAQPAAPEPPHHTVYEDARVRIFEVQMEPQEPAAPQRHDRDFVWVNATEIHFSRANVLHAERNNEVIVELLQPQTGPHNVCSEVLPGEYLHCHDHGPEWLGANLEMQFETDQTRFGILEIAPNAKLVVPPADVPPLLIPTGGHRSRGAQPCQWSIGWQFSAAYSQGRGRVALPRRSSYRDSEYRENGNALSDR